MQYPQLEHVEATEVLPHVGNVGDLVDFVVDELKRTA
jgi:hypothetical protein